MIGEKWLYQLELIYSQRNKIAHHPGAFDERSLEIYANFFKLTIAKTKYEKQTTPDEEIFELLHLSENDINGLQDMMDSYISKLRILTGHDPAPSNPPD